LLRIIEDVGLPTTFKSLKARLDFLPLFCRYPALQISPSARKLIWAAVYDGTVHDAGWFQSGAIEEPLHMTDRTPFHAATFQLTPRQQSILLEMAKGLSYQQIAESLFLSTRTVEREAARLAKTLGVQGPVAVGARAYAVGILNDEHLPGLVELRQRREVGGITTGSVGIPPTAP